MNITVGTFGKNKAQKIETLTANHACGCECVAEYAKGATKKEAQLDEMRIERTMCESCKSLLKTAHELLYEWDIPNDPNTHMAQKVLHGRFVDQKPVTDSFVLGLSAGKIDDRAIIAYAQRGIEDTFSIGQPVYDNENNLVGYMAIRLFENLDYSGLYNGESIPSYTWAIDKPTQYCKKGIFIKTYWQRWRGAENA